MSNIFKILFFSPLIILSFFYTPSVCYPKNFNTDTDKINTVATGDTFLITLVEYDKKNKTSEHVKKFHRQIELLLVKPLDMNIEAKSNFTIYGFLNPQKYKSVTSYTTFGDASASLDDYSSNSESTEYYGGLDATYNSILYGKFSLKSGYVRKPTDKDAWRTEVYWSFNKKTNDLLQEADKFEKISFKLSDEAYRLKNFSMTTARFIKDILNIQLYQYMQKYVRPEISKTYNGLVISYNTGLESELTMLDLTEITTDIKLDMDELMQTSFTDTEMLLDMTVPNPPLIIPSWVSWDKDIYLQQSRKIYEYHYKISDRKLNEPDLNAYLLYRNEHDMQPNKQGNVISNKYTVAMTYGFPIYGESDPKKVSPQLLKEGKLLQRKEQTSLQKFNDLLLQYSSLSREYLRLKDKLSIAQKKLFLSKVITEKQTGGWDNYLYKLNSFYQLAKKETGLKLLLWRSYLYIVSQYGGLTAEELVDNIQQIK